MFLRTKKLEEATKKVFKWTEDGGKKIAAMEVDANEEESEDEEATRRVDEGKEGEVVFRRRNLERKWTPRWGSIIRPKK